MQLYSAFGGVMMLFYARSAVSAGILLNTRGYIYAPDMAISDAKMRALIELMSSSACKNDTVQHAEACSRSGVIIIIIIIIIYGRQAC